MDKTKRILIVKLSSMGDIIHTLPFLKAIKGLYPESDFYWLVNEEFGKLLEGNPYLKGIIFFDRTVWRKNPIKGVRSFMRMISLVRSLDFDMVFDLQGLFRSGLISLLSGSKDRIGLRYSRELSSIFYTRRLGFSTNNNHAVLRNLSVAAELGADVEDIDFPLITEEEEIEKAKELLSYNEGNIYIGLSPFGRWPSKRWGILRYARLGDMLHKEGYKVVLLGGITDIRDAETVASNMQRPPIITAGKTDLKGLIAILMHMNLLVTNDSGPMHIASSIGTPVLAIYGPTDPKRTGPYGDIHNIITAGVKCSPCFKKECREMTCMDSIDVEGVMDSVRMILGNRRGNL